MEPLPFFEDTLVDTESVGNYRAMRNDVSKFNTDILNYSNETFGWCVKHARKSGKSYHRSLLGLARHNLVYMDCIRTLLENGNVEGCEPLLRSMLEAMLGVMHIVEKDSENRAQAYRLARIKQTILKFQMGDNSHDEGKRIEQDIVNDFFPQNLMDELSKKNYAAKAAEIEKQLANDAELKPIITEWNRLKYPLGKKPMKFNPEWYTLFGTATTIKGLAKNLRCSRLYYFTYKDLSNVIHVSKAIETISANGQLRPLRYPAGYGETLSNYFLISTWTFWQLAGHYDSSLKINFARYVANTLNPNLERILRKIKTAFPQPVLQTKT